MAGAMSVAGAGLLGIDYLTKGKVRSRTSCDFKHLDILLTYAPVLLSKASAIGRDVWSFALDQRDEMIAAYKKHLAKQGK